MIELDGVNNIRREIHLLDFLYFVQNDVGVLLVQMNVVSDVMLFRYF